MIGIGSRPGRWLLWIAAGGALACIVSIAALTLLLPSSSAGGFIPMSAP